MKKKFLTLGLFLTLFLGLSFSANAYECTRFRIECEGGMGGGIGLICGNNDIERLIMLLDWAELLCFD
jgi:hypothetical protein